MGCSTPTASRLRLASNVPWTVGKYDPRCAAVFSLAWRSAACADATSGLARSASATKAIEFCGTEQRPPVLGARLAAPEMFGRRRPRRHRAPPRLRPRAVRRCSDRRRAAPADENSGPRMPRSVAPSAAMALLRRVAGRSGRERRGGRRSSAGFRGRVGGPPAGRSPAAASRPGSGGISWARENFKISTGNTRSIKHRREQHAADHDQRQRPLHLRADAGRKRGRYQADAGNDASHHDRPQLRAAGLQHGGRHGQGPIPGSSGSTTRPGCRPWLQCRTRPRSRWPRKR